MTQLRDSAGVNQNKQTNRQAICIVMGGTRNEEKEAGEMYTSDGIWLQLLVAGPLPFSWSLLCPCQQALWPVPCRLSQRQPWIQKSICSFAGHGNRPLFLLVCEFFLFVKDRIIVVINHRVPSYDVKI